MTDLSAALAPGDYTDPVVYAAEIDQVLSSSWLPLCRADQLARPGDRVALTLLGRPVMAVRDRSGAIAVLANVCAHRGSMVVPDGAGHDQTLICGYHRWAYRLDGSLIGAPLADGVDLAGACLPAVRHTVWEGFILVDFSGGAADPSQSLAGLSRHVAPWRWAELVTVGSESFESRWNWKVMIENWVECYHHLGTHRESVEPIQPARTTRIVPSESGPWAAMTVESIEGLEGESAGWMPGLASSDARLLSVWSAFPLLLGGSNAQYAFWLHVVPRDVASHVVTWHLLVHPDRLDRFPPERVAATMAELSAVHREDMLACERVQAGLASGLAQRARLIPLEAPIADFQRWVARRLGRITGEVAAEAR